MVGSNPGGHTFSRPRARATIPPATLRKRKERTTRGSGRSSARGKERSDEDASEGSHQQAKRAKRRRGEGSHHLGSGRRSARGSGTGRRSAGRSGGERRAAFRRFARCGLRRATTEPPRGATRRTTASPGRRSSAPGSEAAAPRPPLRFRSDANRRRPRPHLARHQAERQPRLPETFRAGAIMNAQQKCWRLRPPVPSGTSGTRTLSTFRHVPGPSFPSPQCRGSVLTSLV